MKPRLTDKVLRGLEAMANVAEAGDCCDLLGNDPAPGSETAKTWGEVLVACRKPITMPPVW